MSWIFVADDGEQVHYEVPPRVAEIQQICDAKDAEIAELQAENQRLREAALRALSWHWEKLKDKSDSPDWAAAISDMEKLEAALQEGE